VSVSLAIAGMPWALTDPFGNRITFSEERA